MLRPIAAGTSQVVVAGVGDGFGASVLAFVNGDRSVKRGDTVVWANADPFEIHTVTFPGAGAQPPEFIEPRPQAGGPPALVIPANVAMPVGGDTFTGAYANSGIVGVGGGYALRFDAAPGTYNYLCVIHPWMTGTITVAP
jgi:plastocyanin